MQTLSDIHLGNRQVLLREDLNVPLDEQQNVTSDKRLLAAIPTIKEILEAGAAVVLLSHLGRPKEGEFDAQFSLVPVAKRLSQLLGQDVILHEDFDAELRLQPGQVAMLENVRFCEGEKANDPMLAKKLVGFGDVVVMDAFATAHRAQASTLGIVEAAETAVAGPLLVKELQALDAVLNKPTSPIMAIVGGAKVSTKLQLIDQLMTRVDSLLLGGGIANTFLLAQGYPVGASLCEPDRVDEAKAYLAKAERLGTQILLPSDVVVAKSLAADVETTVKPITEVAADELILDVGPESQQSYAKAIQSMQTILWNGPVGVFENPLFAFGTKALAEAIASSNAYSVAGGGDTVSAIEHFGVTENISYISTGGGAFLEYMEGESLPVVVALSCKDSAA